MGAATSLEEIEEVRMTLSEDNPSFNSTKSFTKAILKEALINNDLSNAKARRLRASALGRRCVCNVQVGRNGFSLQHVLLCEGQVVSFKTDDEDDDEEQDYRVMQVVDSGEEMVDVVGGLGSENRKNYYEQQFNLAGKYHFIVEGLKKPPLLIEVHARKDIEAKVTDEGFEPRIIRLDEGNSVVWTWSDCEVPRFIREASFEADQWMLMIHKDSNVPTKSGTFKKTFNKPGMYYFQTAGLNLDERRTCIVQVRERQREFRVLVEDDHFDPQIIVVEEGDRIWWDWTENEGDKYHCVFEANMSTKDGNLEQSESGIAWKRPTKFGLISREFYQAGVYFYGDREFQKVANYVCTVIVKPAQNDHFIEVNKTGFVPDLLHVWLGDRIWYTWLIDKDEDLEDLDKYIVQLDKTTTGDLPKAGPEKSGEQHMDDLLVIQKYQVGLELVQANQIGVYHHLHKHSGSTCSLICEDGSRNHTITVTDSGFEPRQFTAYLNDRVWWIWQNAKRKHSIVQVNSSGRETDGGFVSGSPMFSPSAFVFQFQEAGKYHYKSPGHMDEVIGIIDIHSRPTVVPVEVGPGNLNPEPVTVTTNDVVAWVFPRSTPYDVQEVNTFDDVMNAQTVPQGILPRRCMCKCFKEPGVFHHSSRSFMDPNNISSRAEDQQISSVIVSDPEDAVVVRIDQEGFHPPHLDLPEDDFVIFDWRETDQPQNVVEIDKDGRAIEPLDNSAKHDSSNEEDGAGNAIRSGEPEMESSFQHYFDLSGVFRFTSDSGRPGRTCVVNVGKNVGKTDMPEIVGYEHRAVKVPQHQIVHLKCKDPKADIHYTLDGGLPYLHRKNILKYDAGLGIHLSTVGITFIRALAVSPGLRRSDVFTSKKFFVLPQDEDSIGRIPLRNESLVCNADEGSPIHPITIEATPIMSGSSTICWNQDFTHQTSGIQLLVNGVPSSILFDPRCQGLKLTGLSPDSKYNVKVISQPISDSDPPFQSNMLELKKSRDDGDFVIFLKTAPSQDSILLMWNFFDGKVEGFQVFLSGIPCGHTIYPNVSKETYSVLLSSLKYRTLHKIFVTANFNGGKELLPSNELVFSLPLDARCILLPGKYGTEIIKAEELVLTEFLSEENLTSDPPGDGISNKRSKEVRFAVPGESSDGSSNETRSTVKDLLAGERNFTTLLSTEAIDDDSIPMAYLSIKAESDNSTLVSWIFKKEFDPDFRRTSNYVNVVGKRFEQNINSDLSFECFMETDGAEPAVQHIWNVSEGDRCTVNGLSEDTDYRIHVVTCYEKIKPSKHEKVLEVQATSHPVSYKIQKKTRNHLKIDVISSEPNTAKLVWHVEGISAKSRVVGYQVTADGSPIGEILDANAGEIMLEKLLAGKSVVVGVTPVFRDSDVGPPTSTVQLFCPCRPRPPLISEQPSNDPRSAVIAWNYPEGESECEGDDNDFDDISTFRIYVDNKCVEEMKVTTSSTKHGYQYLLKNLIPGISYEIHVTSCSGNHGSKEMITIRSESVPSNILTISSPAPPHSPLLRLDNMNSNGIELSWDVVQQSREDQIAGYQLYKNNKLYGSILPGHVHNMTLKNLKLGESLNLRLVAVPKEQELLESGEEDVGTTIKVRFSGIVSPPSRVWTENVSGRSALIRWTIGDPPDHHIKPDSYQLTWWPGNKAHSDINSGSTTDEQMNLCGLREGKLYTVVVESRSKCSYIEVDGVTKEQTQRSFIVTSRSDPLTFCTTSPLAPPSNLSINSTTCDSILVTWDFQEVNQDNVLGYRIDAIPTNDNSNSPDLVTFDFPRGSKLAKLVGLKEKTEYLVTITVVTREYFEQPEAESHNSRKKTLPKGIPAPRNKWLPRSSIKCVTSGTDIASDLKVVSIGPDRVTLQWQPVKVHGSNRLLETAIRWSRLRNHNGPEVLGQHKVVQSDRDRVTIKDLEIGETYKFVVVATVSQKTKLEDDEDDPPDLKTELEGRIDNQLFSRSVVARTSAPCPPPRPIVTGFTTTSCQLYWEKPSMHLAIGNRNSSSVKRVKLVLLGYRMEVNGKPHMRLSPATQSCTLVKCKAGKKYKVVLVALTCPSTVLRSRRKDVNFGTLDSSVPSFEAWKGTTEDADYDASSSETISISIPPIGAGFLFENFVRFTSEAESKKLGSVKKTLDGDRFGNVLVKWSIQEEDVAEVKQINVTWKTVKDDGISVQQESYEANIKSCSIPVYSKKCLVEVLVQPADDFNEENNLPKNTQPVQVLIPGPPDRPDLWLKTIRENEFVVEWSTPTLNGGKVEGYQLFINGKKAEGRLGSNHSRAVVPCKTKRLYHVTLVALSSEPHLGHSEPSDVLTVSTFPSFEGHSNESNFQGEFSRNKHGKRSGVDEECNDDNEDVDEDDRSEEMSLKVLQNESNLIELSWRGCKLPSEAAFLKIKWKLFGQKNKREVKLSADETSCILHNCIPGSTYSVCLYAYSGNNKIIERSSAIKVTTPAPIKPPVLLLKALNFNYFTVEWNDVSSESSLLIGYKIFMNGVLQCSLRKDQNLYSYSGGEWCKEYMVQVQALAEHESYNSILSEPLVITCPGVMPPLLSQASSRKSNVVRLVWDRIVPSGNAKVKNLKVVVCENKSDKVIQFLNLPPNSNECEVEGLDSGNYFAFMDIQLHGTQRSVRTENISIAPVPVVKSPIISVKILNLETRRLLDVQAAALINRRDRLLSSNYKESFLPQTGYVPQNSNNYSRDDAELKAVEENLDSCLAIIDEHFAGTINALLTWSLTEAEQDTRITGVQLYVNGRKYGHELKPTIKAIPVLLPAAQMQYQIFMKVMSTTDQSIFQPSNVVEISTDPFLPFSFFTFFSQKPKRKHNTYLPVPYSETLAIERKYSSKRPVHQGYLRKPVGLSSSLMGVDIFDRSSRNLFSSSRSGLSSVLYFWSPQSLVAVRMLEWLKGITTGNLGYGFNILTVACGSANQTLNTEELEGLVTSGWNDKDLTGCSHFLGGISINGGETLTEIFGVVGFPTFVFLNRERNIVWRGRYCALDSNKMNEFFKFVMVGVDSNVTSSLPDPWLHEIQFNDTIFRNQLLSSHPNLAFDSSGAAVWASRTLPTSRHQIPQKLAKKKPSV